MFFAYFVVGCMFTVLSTQLRYRSQSPTVHQRANASSAIGLALVVTSAFKWFLFAPPGKTSRSSLIAGVVEPGVFPSPWRQIDTLTR